MVWSVATRCDGGIVVDTSQHNPRVFDVLAGEAETKRETPYGSVGVLHSGSGVRAEWVSKRAEEIDPDWFSQNVVDLICVVAGTLRVEFERGDIPTRTLEVGQVLILPPGVRCRAYSWPRDESKGLSSLRSSQSLARKSTVND
jgi:hypothetical protein